jgi:hypothetical protein
MRRQQLPAVAIILSFAFLPLTDRALAASGAEPPYASKRARQSRQRALFILICRGLPQAPGLQSYFQHRSCRSPSLAKPSYFHWTIYGAILALVGIAQVVWSNTRQIRT